jgi:hypothetical protein
VVPIWYQFFRDVPDALVLGSVRLAPDTEEFPQARLFIRGFAAHQIVVALVCLASVVQRD